MTDKIWGKQPDFIITDDILNEPMNNKPFIDPSWIKFISQEKAMAEATGVGIAAHIDYGTADLTAAAILAMRDGTVCVVNVLDLAMGVELRRQVIDMHEMYQQGHAHGIGYFETIHFIKKLPDETGTATPRVLDAKSQFKYQKLLAQYNRAKAQRNKTLMRDLEQQLLFYR